MKNIIIFSIALSLFFFNTEYGYSQQALAKNPDSLFVNQLAKELQITNVRALSVVTALSLHRTEIGLLVNNKGLTPKDKHQQLMTLIQNRENQVNALLSTQERQRLSIFMEIRFHDQRNQFKKNILQSKLMNSDTSKTH